MKIINKFGLEIKKIRLEKNLTQEMLAKKAGLHRTYISDIERGARNISLFNVDKIARALDVKVSQLLKD